MGRRDFLAARGNGLAAGRDSAFCAGRRRDEVIE